MRVIKEIYVLPDGDQFILYAPLKRTLLTVNYSAVSLLKRMRDGSEVPDDAETLLAVDRLKTAGIVDADESCPPPHGSNGDYRPTNVTFLPTSDCNLRCIYCYADSGTTSRYLSPDVARSAIDLVCANAREKKVQRVQVGFLGGGEPFLAWDMIQEIVAYARMRANESGLSTYFTGVTNGMLSEERIRWISENFQYLNISLDGTRAIQDRHRPTRDRGGSYETVIRTVGLLREATFKFAIRSTISSISVNQMVPIVEFFSHELGVAKIQLEPLFACGRCRTTSQLAPIPEVFAENFKACLEVVRSTQTELLCSGIRLDALSSTFCGALGDNFYITPDGYVTSCTEVSSPEEALAEVFFIGKYDRDTHSFVFWDDRRKILASRSVPNLRSCGGCISKWHCAGGCPAKAALGGDIFDPTRLANCKIARNLTEHSIRTATHGLIDLPGITVRPISADMNQKR